MDWIPSIMTSLKFPILRHKYNSYRSWNDLIEDCFDLNQMSSSPLVDLRPLRQQSHLLRQTWAIDLYDSLSFCLKSNVFPLYYYPSTDGLLSPSLRVLWPASGVWLPFLDLFQTVTTEEDRLKAPRLPHCTRPILIMLCFQSFWHHSGVRILDVMCHWHFDDGLVG